MEVGDFDILLLFVCFLLRKKSLHLISLIRTGFNIFLLLQLGFGAFEWGGDDGCGCLAWGKSEAIEGSVYRLPIGKEWQGVFFIVF